MTYEFRVTDLASEFGVHRNTIRNWINSGVLPATRTAGKRYRVRWRDYARLCAKYGRSPRQPSNRQPDLEELRAMTGGSTPPPFLLDSTAHGPIPGELVSRCTGCGACAAACGISGIDGLDPRKIIRMVALNLEEELLGSDWPWKCTLCRRCELSCPAEINIVDIMRALRGRRPRPDVPGYIQEGVEICLKKGNNIGIPRQDLLRVLAELEQRMRSRAHPEFILPVDQHGARLLVLLNAKIVYAEPEQLESWCTVLSVAGESWTLSSRDWEESNWAYFSGDDRAWRKLIKKTVGNLQRLGCQALLLPGCGHAAEAMTLGLRRWFPEILEQTRVYTPLDLMAEYLTAGRIRPDPGCWPGPVTYHAPCHYGRGGPDSALDHGEEKARQVITACCLDFVPLDPAGENTFCCGAGGGVMATPFKEEQVLHGRLKARQIRESGARVVVTPCPTCLDQIRYVLTREFDLAIQTIFPWQLVAESLHRQNSASSSTLSQGEPV